MTRKNLLKKSRVMKFVSELKKKLKISKVVSIFSGLLEKKTENTFLLPLFSFFIMAKIII